MKKLGFGLMRLPTLDKNDPSKVDLEQLKQMVDLFLEKGFTYFDTAWMYNAFASEGAAKAALVDRHPRESFTLATKLHAARLALEAGIDMVIANGSRMEALYDIVDGKDVGTRFSASLIDN